MTARRRAEAVAASRPAPQPRPEAPELAVRRLQKLDGAQRRLLLAAALQTGPRPAPVFSRMLGGGSGALLARLSAGRFLTMAFHEGRRVYMLAREADRAALLQLADPAEVRDLHAAAASALAASGAPVEEIARHHIASDPAGRGAAWALRAGAALAGRGDPEGALEFYQAALDAGRGGTEVHRGIAAALRARGDALGALRHVGLARRGAGPRDLRELRADAAALCVAIGKLRSAERLCLQTLGGQVEMDAADPTAARAYATLCEIRLQRGDVTGAVEACRAGMTDGLDARTRIDLRNTLGKALLAQARLDEASACFEANVADAAELPRERMLARINLGVVAHRRGDRQVAVEHYRAALEITRTDPIQVALARGNLGTLHYEAGDFHLAATEYAAALAACTLSRRAGLIGYWARNSARLQIFLGAGEEALSYAERARGAASRVRDPYQVAGAALVRGEALEVVGDLEGAATELAAARDRFAASGHRRYEAESGIALARVLLARGERHRAADAVARLDGMEICASTAALSVEVHLVAGEVALAVGDLPLAHRRAQLAREVLLSTPVGVGGDTDLEAPWRAYHLLGRIHQALGQPGEAAAHRLRAVRLLDELASRVPPEHRARFLAVGHRAALLHASADGEIGPDRAARARRLPEEPAAHARIVGSSPAVLRVVERIAAVAASNVPLLIRGETGTGKDLLASAIHEAGPRRAARLVRVTCSGLQEEQLLSELFGHEKGAFPGAVRERRGRFELAAGGTLFLDEIGDLPPRAQVGLLRALQHGEIERLGGTEPFPTDARVICATSRDLEQLTAAGAFRPDLYHHLKGMTLTLPPLRERREDIPLLARHFLEAVARERMEPPRTLSPAALERLIACPWPGNVRELEHVVRSVSLLTRSEVVDVDTLALHEGLPPTGEPATRGAPGPRGELDFYGLARERHLGLRDMTHQVEMQMVRRALDESRGNIARAAVLLRMKRSRLSQIVNAHDALRMLTKEGGS